MKSLITFVLFVAILSVALDAFAQARTNSSGGGMFGTSTGSTGTLAGTSAFGGSSRGGTGTGNFGNMGLGNLGTGGSSRGGINGISGFGQNGMNSANMQSGQFIGANTNPNQFIGASPNQTGNTGRGMTGQNFGGMNTFGQGNRQMGLNNPMNNSSGTSNSQNQRQLTTAFHVDFAVPVRPSAATSSSLTRELQDTPGIHRLSPLVAVLQDRTLILKGTVAAQHDKELVERLMRLEPGVDKIQNELVVGKSISLIESR